MIDDKNKKLLLDIARKSIISKLNNEKFELKNIPSSLKEKRGVFVTLEKNNELRGCIGYIQPIKSIIDSVKENAVNAAFKDTRFPPLTEDELNDIKIEISILSLPEKLEFKDSDELLEKLNSDMGVILKRGFSSSTFLPQVWEQLPDKKDFLSHLSVKAGLPFDAWKDEDIEIEVYYADKFGE